jgi:putative ABC transport system permease protein
MLSVRWLKVIRDLWYNKSRTLLVVLSIAVGVTAFGGLYAARDILMNNLNTQFTASNHYDIQMNISGFDDTFVRWASRQSNITSAQGIALHTEKMILNGKTFDVAINAYGDMNDISINRLGYEAGTFPPGRDEFVIERSFLSVLDIEIGDQVTFEINKDKHYQQSLVGTVHDINAVPGALVEVVQVYTSTRTLYRFGLPTDYNTLYLTVDRQNVDDLFEFTDEFVDTLTRMGLTVTDVRVNEVSKHWAADTIAGLVVILIVIGAFSLILSGLLVVNTISGLLIQQRRQIGIMKTIGASSLDIAVLYLVMVAIYGLLAVMIGIPGSWFLAKMISDILGSFLNLNITEFSLPALVIVMEIAAGLLIPLISALKPILDGTGISVLEAINDVSSKGSNLIDVLLSKIRGLPTTYLLSLRNMFRRKMRLLFTMITLIIAGAVFIAIINVRTSIRSDARSFIQMSSYDIGFSLDGFYDSNAVQRRIQNQIKGVVASEGWLNVSVNRVRPDDVEGESFLFAGVPFDSRFINPDIESGVWLNPPDRGNRFDIVISSSLLDTEPDIRLGDKITLKYNGEERDWRVVGILWGNNTAGGGSQILAYSYYESVMRFSKHMHQTNQIGIAATGDSSALLEQLELNGLKVLDRYDIDVSSTSILENQLGVALASFDVIVALMVVCAIIIAIVGGLGLSGTLSLNVMERTREIGILRSVGASTNTLRFMFISEGVMIGILSALVGTIISFGSTALFGSLLGIVVRGRPWSYQLTFTGPIFWLLIILIVSAVASVIPAQRAAQISIREAISYE